MTEVRFKYVLLAVLLAGLLAAVIFWLRRRRFEAARRGEIERMHNVAHLFERMESTSGGAVSAVLLVAWTLGCLVWFLGSKSAVQEAAVALVWIGGNQILIMGITLGRTRRFVMRKPDPDGQPHA